MVSGFGFRVSGFSCGLPGFSQEGFSAAALPKFSSRSPCILASAEIPVEGLFENRVAQHRRLICGQVIGDHIRPLFFVMVQEGWSMPLFHPADDVHVLVRFHAITHGPEDRGLIGRVDVLVYRNNDLAHAGMKRAGRVQRAPDFGLVGAAHLNNHQFIGVGEGSCISTRRTLVMRHSSRRCTSMRRS